MTRPDSSRATKGRPLVLGLVFVLVFAALLVIVAGCDAPLDRVDFCVIQSRPGATVSERTVSVTKGEVIALKANPIATDGDIMDDDTEITLESGNPGVLGAAPLDHESERCPGYKDADWYFVLYGVETGQTTLKVWVNNHLWREIPAHVTNP